MSVSFAIMCHPSRLGHVDTMTRRLAEQGAFHISVAVDNNLEGPWATSKRAWNMRDPKSTHHVVLQDDISFSPDFVSSVANYLLPRPVSFSPPLGSKVFRGSQALMLPTEIVRSLLSWHPANGWALYGRIDDVWLGAFFKAHGHEVVYASPPLVKHEGVGRSLLWSTRGNCAKVSA